MNEHATRTVHDGPSWPAAGGGGGESSIAALQARARAGVEQVLRGFPDVDHVCIVAQAHWSKVLLMHLLRTADDEVDDSSISNSVDTMTQPPWSYWEQENSACINVLNVDANGRWKLEMMNHLQHLETVFA